MRVLFCLALILAFGCSVQAEEPKSLKVLFLGDEGHHRPIERFRQLEKPMAQRKIELVYTDKATALNAKTLSSYDGLIIYANTDVITPEQESALLDYVESGKGFIPLHCASFCFRNSEKYVALVGAQFQKHGTGVFRVTPDKSNHPITESFSGFESWDESYVHTKHNTQDRTVLEYREDKDGKEPWTWVRTHGKGRVFYTAWGHDERTWAHAGFVNLVERGIRWACGQDKSLAPEYSDQPQMTGPAKDLKKPEYVNAKIPFYPAGKNSGAGNEPTSKMPLPFEPNESIKHYQHPADLEMKLFASEPHFGGKPIALNWDERGRLWVCVTVDYPNELQPAGQGRDKIVICEDTNGDGVADKYTVFADKLSIPTSITFAYGGVIVHQAPDTLFLRDKTGDDVTDERYALFTGWGTRDTHAGPSNLRYGLDGWYYGIVGYSGFDGTIAGEAHRFGQGFYRFKLDQDATQKVSVTKFEFLRGTSNNSWGVGFSEEGLLFGSTANGCASVFLAVPNRYYEKVRGWSSSVLPNITFSNTYHPITEKVRQVDWHHGFTSAAGHALYTARNYPKQYWNRTAFVSDPTGHLTATMVLQPYGSDFQTRYGWNLVAGVDEWNAPIVAEVGPDGNVWVLDWYNFIVQHNPTPVGFQNGKGNAYETDLRDKKHGRIYRLVAKDPQAPTPNLKDASAAELVKTLKNPTMFWRLHAQRLLVERQDKSVADALNNLIQDQSTDEIGLNVGAIHAIRVLGQLGQISKEDKVLSSALKHPSAGVRRNAVLAASPESVVEHLGALGSDSDAQVRLATFLAVAEAKENPKVGERLRYFLVLNENLLDRWILDAITSAAATHDLGFLSACCEDPMPPKALSVIAIVAEHLARRAPEQGLDGLLSSLAKATPEVRDTIVTALAKGWPKGKTVKLTPEAEKSITDLFAKLSASSKGSLVKLANGWGSKVFEKYAAEISKSLLEAIQNDKLAEDQRISAAKQLIEFKPSDLPTINAILELITPRSSPSLVTGFLEALGSSTATEATEGLLKNYPTWSPSTRNAALRILLSRADSATKLLAAAEKGIISLNDLALDQKQSLADHPDKALAKRAKALLAKGGGLPNADRQKVIDEMAPLLKKTFDASAGKAMFVKHCAACHVHSGEGGKVGPDLTGMNVHPKEELLVHILDPSRSVEGNFRAYTVRTADGKVLTGMLASETKTSIELIDSQAKKFTLLREDIDSLTASNKSVMPEGFEKQMNPDEFGNLLEFLTKRGKFLPIPLDKSATIVSTKGMFFDEKATAERLVFSDWKPKTFDGVPFLLVDPQGDKIPNVILLNSTSGPIPSKMPKSVSVQVNSAAKTIHLLGGVGGWASPYGNKGSVSLIVRLIYADGQKEDHQLKNGEQIADYIRRVDVPNSKFAFDLAGRQVRYLTVTPKRPDVIKQIEFVKGTDSTAPVVVAVTVEGRE